MAGTWRRRGLLLAAVLAGGVGAWLALHGGGTQDPSAAAHGGGDGPERTAAGPILEGTRAAPAVRTGRSALTGRVTQAGRPVEAEVEVLWRAEAAAADLRAQATTHGVLSRFELPPPPEGPGATVATDAEGRFEARGLAPGAYEVRAKTSDGARGQAGVLVPLDGMHVHVEIVVAAASGVLRGRIQHADGSPYRGAAFVRTNADADAPWPTSLGTPLALDASAAFEARGLPLGPVHVQVVDPGGVWVRGPRVTLPTNEPYVLTLGAEPGRVGRVLARDDGTPIPGAIVIGSAYPAGGGMLLLHTTTDAEGNWRLALPAQGLYAVRAQAPGFAMLRLDGEELPGANQPIELRLAREAVLAGRVIAVEDGRPVPGVSVRVLPQRRNGDFFTPPAVVSDARGLYEVRGLPTGTATVLAEGAGWAPARMTASRRTVAPDPWEVELVGGRVTTRDLVVEAAGRLRGRVLDAEGAPLAGAVVWAEGRQGPNSYSAYGAHESLAPPSVTTDDQGAFVLEGLAPSAAHVVLARSPSGQEAHSELVRLGVEPQAPVEIRFVAQRTVEVRVENASTGAPVVSAHVRPSDREPPGAPVIRGLSPGADTQADGTARLRVPVGVSSSLEVFAGGYAGAEDVRVLAEQASVLVRLTPILTVTGRVLHADGSPAHADVRGWKEGKKGWRRTDWVRTRPDGTFRIESPATGSIWMRASATGAGGVFVGEAHATSGDPPVTITLRPIAEVPPAPGVLRVRVLDPAGAPVPNAYLELLGRGSVSTDVTQGWAELLEADWAGGTIVVTRARDDDDVALPVGPGRLGPLDAARPEVELRLPPEQVIEGVVRTADGRGVRGARVSAQTSEREGGAGFLYVPDARTDGEGRFRLGSLGAGTYDLEVATLSHGLRKVRDVAAGRRDLVVTLGEGVQATITVLDDVGRPVPGAHVRAEGPDGFASPEARADARGIARLTALPQDEPLTLEVWLPDAETGEDRGTSLRDWRPADTTVRLPALRIATGRVVDAAGQPVADAILSVQTATEMAVTVTDEEGRFRFAVQGPGEITVSVMEGEEAIVEAPFRGVPLVLVLDPGLELTVHIDPWNATALSDTTASLVSPGGQMAHVREAPVDAGGSVRFKRLKADTTYALWIPPQEDGRSLLLRDVRPASGPLRVQLRPGRSITGRVQAPAGARLSVSARLEGAPSIRVRGTQRQDGTYEIAGLPEGRWKLTLFGETSDAIITRSAVVEAGGTHDFDLTKER